MVIEKLTKRAAMLIIVPQTIIPKLHPSYAISRKNEIPRERLAKIR
tara:strand:+ start:267 stop:404 length:138 start_codon:yes stop_codon:yes gene_type:complete